MKYLYKLKEPSNIGRPRNPNLWISGPCPEQHEKYYAWLKHRAQANYRGEQYDLTWEDWQQLWSADLWARRGRKRTDLCLQRLDFEGEWSIQNCEVVERVENLRRQAEYRKNK